MLTEQGSEPAVQDNPEEPRRTRITGKWLTLSRVLALLGVVAITVLIFSFRDRASELSGYGYAGIFLVSILANATLILPVPGVALTFTMGAVFNPLGVALAAGAGATLGELTGYIAGFGGQGIVAQNRTYDRLVTWMRSYGPWVITVLSFVPNPLFDLAGAAAGALRMPVAKFLFWTWIGKTLKMLIVAYAGFASMEGLFDFLK